MKGRLKLKKKGATESGWNPSKEDGGAREKNGTDEKATMSKT